MALAAEYAPVRELRRSLPPSMTGSLKVHNRIGTSLKRNSTSEAYAALAKGHILQNDQIRIDRIHKRIEFGN